MARIKLLRNKREVQVRQMRRDVAMLLEGRQDSTARIRVTSRLLSLFEKYLSFFSLDVALRSPVMLIT